MAKPKTIEAMMADMTDPGTIELNAKYQNARDAVSWAWRIAQDLAVANKGEGYTVESMSEFVDELIPKIEANLNNTLEVLREAKSA